MAATKPEPARERRSRANGGAATDTGGAVRSAMTDAGPADADRERAPSVVEVKLPADEFVITEAFDAASTVTRHDDRLLYHVEWSDQARVVFEMLTDSHATVLGGHGAREV